MKLLRGVLLALAIGCAVAQEEGEEEPMTEQEKKDKAKREEIAKYEYCREDNCYELLGVTKESKQPAIKRKYRALAAKWHPDKNPDPRAKDLFQKYANAYEVLSNEKMRSNYDYLNAHPHEFPMFFMRFSKPVYMPKSDLRFVLVLTIGIISAIQFLLKQSTYQTQLEAMKKDPNYQLRLKQLIKEQDNKTSAKKAGAGFRGDAGTTKGKKGDELKAEELEKRKAVAEAQLAEELASIMPSQPKLSDTIAIEMFKLPLTLSYGLKFYGTWFLKYKLAGQEYDAEAMEYLTMRAVGVSKKEWAAASEEEKEELVSKQLWVPENLAEWEAAIGPSSPGKKSGKDKRLARQKKKGPIGSIGELMD